MIHVFYCRSITKIDDIFFKSLVNEFPKPIQQNVLKYRNWQDRQRTFFGKLLLLKGIQILKYPISSLKHLKYSSLNRPYFEGGPNFNISHSGNYILCAISGNSVIGIDIEEVKPIDIHEFKREFAIEEIKGMMTAKDTLHSFYRLWTQKEAFLKAIGKGLYVELNKVHILNHTIEWEDNSWFLQDLNIADGYLASVCYNTPTTELHLRELKFDHFFN